MLTGPGLMARVNNVGALALACRGLVGRLLKRGNVLLAYDGDGCAPQWSGPNSSSACSGMFGSRLKVLHEGEVGYASSIADRIGLLRRPWFPSGDAGLRGTAPRSGGMKRPVESTPGEECARCNG